jgi:hypothetical protein
MCYSPICTGPWFPLHLYNYRTVLVHVLRTRGGLNHYTTCKLTINVWCGQQCHSRRHLIIIFINSHQNNSIWTSYGSIWTGPSPKQYYMDVILQYMDRSVNKTILYGPQNLRSGPYNICLVTDRSIYCHMNLSAMNYLLFINIIIKCRRLWHCWPHQTLMVNLHVV